MKRNQRAQISVEISLEQFLPNNKKPETSRGRAQGRVLIAVANNIRQLTVITSKALKKGRKYLSISACASIVQEPNTEPAIIRLYLQNLQGKASHFDTWQEGRREPGMTANLIGDSSVIHPVVVINMGGYKFRAPLGSGASHSYVSSTAMWVN